MWKFPNWGVGGGGPPLGNFSHIILFFSDYALNSFMREQMFWYQYIRKPPSHLSAEVRFFWKSLGWIKHFNRKRMNMSTIELRRVFPALEATSLDGVGWWQDFPTPFITPCTHCGHTYLVSNLDRVAIIHNWDCCLQLCVMGCQTFTTGFLVSVVW